MNGRGQFFIGILLMRNVLQKVWLVSLFTLAGCGSGPGWLGAGLVIEDLLDPDERGDDGLDCWDLDGDLTCGEEEDWTGPEGEPDAVCDVWDCQGIPGIDGADGASGPQGPAGDVGAAGPVGTPGVTTVIIVRPGVQPEPPRDDPAGGIPPYGNAWGSDGPKGNQERP
jgi:hypothetical protein